MHEQLRADLMAGSIVFDTKLEKVVKEDFSRVSRSVTDTGKVAWMSKHDSTGHADLASAVVLLVDAWHKHPSQAS